MWLRKVTCVLVIGPPRGLARRPLRTYTLLMAKRAPGRKTHRNTEGRRRLASYLKPVGSVAQATLAATMNIGQQTISAWKRGTCRPEPHHRDALERIAGIPAESWYSPDELAMSRGAPRVEAKAS